MKKGCCEEKHQILKIDDTQQNAELFLQKFSNPFHALITIPDAFSLVIFVKGISTAFTYPLSGPDNYGPPIYLLNRVLRI